MITTLALLATLLNPMIPIQDAPTTPNPSPQTSSPLNVQSVDTLNMRCMPREQLISHIKTSNHAVPMFVAMSGNNGSDGAIEFWRDTSNKDRELWISFITKPNGKSCIVMQGDGFGLADPKAFYEAPNFDYDAQGKPHPHVDAPSDHS